MRVFKFLIIYFSGILFLIAQDQNSVKNILKDQGYPLDSFYVGGTINHSSLGTKIEKLFLGEFNYLTPENASKQTTVHPRPGVWQWKKHDDFIDFADKNNITLRIHGPVSPQASKWAKNDNRTRDELIKNMEEYFIALCKRLNNEKSVKWMDVVNETVLRNGEWFAEKPGDNSWENPWTQIGLNEDGFPIYIIRAFEIANKYAPNIRLVYNHNGGMEKVMWFKVLETIEYLRNIGLRVDGLGWQAHLRGKGLNKEDLDFLSLLIDWAHKNDMGFHVTELNFWLRNENPNSIETNNIQTLSYINILNTLISKKENGILTLNHWGLNDRPGKGNFPKYILSIYENGKPKQALYALKKALIDKKTNLYLQN